jgi:non-ribosomal peptide synthase protein (TIGR01720 family)
LPQAEVLFNYLGQWDQALPDEALFGPALESSGPAHSSRGARPYLLEINSSVEEGCLRLGWRYSEHIHQRATIERLAQGFVEALQALIAHCRSVEVGSHTPSDFPLVEIDQQSLDRLVVAHSPIEDIYPPGPMQQHMLFHRFYKPEPGLYVLHHERPVTGIPLDLAAFERAWQAVVDRQPILRTSFVADGLDEPLQVVHKEVQVPVEYQDWRGLPPPEQEEKLRTLVRQSRQRGFEPSATPHLRLTVIQMDEDTYQFLMVFSYIQLDGWSHVLVLKEFLDLYTAFSRDQEPHLKRPRPYRDYIAWAQEQDLAKAERFWRKTLEGFTEPISLTDHPSCGPTGQKDDVCGKQVLALSTATTAALESLARRHQLTLNTMLQGAWAMLLSRCTGRRDVVFGGLVSGRPAALPEIESMVGLFINVLPVRVQVSPPASLLPWLKAIQDQQVEQRQYQYSPPLKVKEWSDVQEDLPLFEDYLVFQNFPVDASLQDYADNWGIGKIRAIAQTEHPLRVEAYPMPAMPLIMTYHRHRFDDAKIEAMLRHFKTLLEGFATSPERRLGALMSVIER